jgi:hypothetical protein
MIYRDFESISNDDSLHKFIRRYGLTPVSQDSSTWNLGEWAGFMGSNSVNLGFRWHDPSGPFNIQPDMHITKLTIADSGGIVIYQKEIKYPDTA